MTSKLKQAKREAAEKELLQAGATLERREDRHGDTRSGWWLDGVWLAPKHLPADALRIIKGD